MFDNAGAGAASAQAGGKTPGETPSSAPAKTARTNQRDNTFVFMISLPIGNCFLTRANYLAAQ
jgi:hypothetical protein